MKKLTLSQWEEKYIVGPVERFDQKYIMFIRPSWDPELKGRLKDWSFKREVKQRPGDTQQDLALRWAAGAGTRMGLFNTSKPNPSHVSQAIMKALAASNPGSQARQITAHERPKGAKIDVSDPQTITRDIKKVATFFGADLVGICKLDRRWVYSHTWPGLMAHETGNAEPVVEESIPQEIPEECQYAVVMCFEQDYNLLKYFTTSICNVATGTGYSRMAITNAHLSRFIRELGFKAIDCTTNDVALSIPMAMQAGLGELGRNGLLITPQFGPRVRVSKVITDLPLIPDTPIEFGVTEFCRVCKKCADVCSSQSIIHGERTAKPNSASNVAGELKWPVNAETCRTYWSQVRTCTSCVSCCPYNKADTWFHRTIQWFTDNVRWADSFYVKMDDLLGYGKPKKADNFWKEWQP